MGALADLLNDNITDDTNLDALARSAGIERSTLDAIRGGAIECPPVRRLRAFARGLNISLQSLQDAGDRDGCNYSGDDKSQFNDIFRKFIESIHGSFS